MLRQVLTALLGMCTASVAVSCLGFDIYGTYAGALGLVGFCAGVGYMGIGGYLLRFQGAHQDEVYHQAFSLLGAIGLLGVVAGLAIAPFIGKWIGVPEFDAVAVGMLVSLPLVLLSRVPQCIVERNLDYRTVALVEFAASVLKSSVALGLLVAGFGIWSLVVSWWIYQAALNIGFMRSSGYRPSLRWERRLIFPMFQFGLKIWAARAVLNIKELVNPLVVGKMLGAEAMGHVAMAITLCEACTMFLSVSHRLSAGLFGKIHKEDSKIMRAISDGTFIQVWLAGSVLVGMSWIGSETLPYFFGLDWELTTKLLPFLAIFYLSSSITQLHASALFTDGKGYTMLVMNSLQVIVFFFSTIFLIPMAGLLAFGLGSAFGGLVSLSLLWITKDRFYDKKMNLSLVSAAGFALALFVPQLGLGAILGLLLVVSWQPIRIKLKELVREGYRNIKIFRN